MRDLRFSDGERAEVSGGRSHGNHICREKSYTVSVSTEWCSYFYGIMSLMQWLSQLTHTTKYYASTEYTSVKKEKPVEGQEETEFASPSTFIQDYSSESESPE